MAKKDYRKELEKEAKMPGTDEKSWLDNVLGGIGDFASSDRGKQILSGLLAQAVSDQSYGGGTFLAGMEGARESQAAKAAQQAKQEQTAIENLLAGRKIDAEELKARAAATKAGVDVDEYNLSKQESVEQALREGTNGNYDKLPLKEKLKAKAIYEKTGVVPKLKGTRFFWETPQVDM